MEKKKEIADGNAPDARDAYPKINEISKQNIDIILLSIRVMEFETNVAN